MNELFRNRFAAALVLFAVLTPLAAAQDLPEGATWDRSSLEEGFLNDFSLTRTVLGPRAIGMGRAGLALSAGVEYHTLNPASILGFDQIQLFTQGNFRSGSASVDKFPTYLKEVETDFSDFSTKPGSNFGYSGINLGLPLVLFGGRGALGVGYARHRLTPLPEENREEALGELTENTPSTVGIRRIPNGGYDALTFTAARRLFDSFDVGANLNYENGWLQQRHSVDASVFGRPAAAEKRKFTQDFSSLQFDVGARGDLGSFSWGLSYFFGHHIDYENGRVTRVPLYVIGDDTPTTIRGPVMDHTLSVPPRLGLGGAYHLGERMTVAVDYWKQDWSKASFTRQPVESVFTFADLSDSASFFHYLVPVDGPDVVLGARMSDTKSLRIGAEYTVMQNETMRVPVRVGWHSEGLTRGEVDIDVFNGRYDDYLKVVGQYRRDLENGVPNPESEQLLREFLQNGALVHRTSKEFTTSTITLGAGIEVAELTVDASLDVTSMDASRYFNTVFSPQWWPFVYETEGTRTISTFSLAARLSF